VSELALRTEAFTYFFPLRALDAKLDGGRKLDRALAGHVLATAELRGAHER
jgi:hypothetical protein